MTEIAPASPIPTAVVTVVQRSLQLLGWEVRELDVSVDSGVVSLRLFRNDGRWIHLHRDHVGRVVIERWQRRAVVTKYRPGRNPTCDGFVDDFLGRERSEGLRSGLRAVGHYLADNSGDRMLGRDAVRPLAAAFAALEAAP